MFVRLFPTVTKEFTSLQWRVVGYLRTPISGVVFRNCVFASTGKLSTPVSCAGQFESASGYSVTSTACSFNQPVLFVPIIMQIECHSGAMRCQQRRRSFECSRLTECRSHGLWFLLLVLLMFLLLIHLILIFFSVSCPRFSYTFILIFPCIFFLLCFCISSFHPVLIFISLSSFPYPLLFIRFSFFASIGYINIPWGKMRSLYC